EQGEKIAPYVFKLTDTKSLERYLKRERITYEVYYLEGTKNKNVEVNPFEKKLTEKTLVENVENNTNINQEPRDKKRSLEEEENKKNIRPNKKPLLETEKINSNPDINQESRGQKRALSEEEEGDSRPNKKPALEIKTNEDHEPAKSEV